MAINIPPVTAAKRSKLYVVLAFMFLIIAIFAVVGAVLPFMGVLGDTQIGLFTQCQVPRGNALGTAWIARQCQDLRRQSICNGWYQTARTSALLGISLSIIACILAVLCAMQSVITTALPLLLLVIAAMSGILVALVPGAWIIFAGSHCNDSEASASASFILFVLAAVINLFGTCLATYLFKADILCPADEEYQSYPTVYETAPSYAAAPMSYPTVTYAAAPTPILY
jgi:hypothetical protein